jgi:hypothetical protein
MKLSDMTIVVAFCKSSQILPMPTAGLGHRLTGVNYEPPFISHGASDGQQTAFQTSFMFEMLPTFPPWL